MIIAIDYDGTYDRDPAAWDKAILALQDTATIICVTSRTEEQGQPVLSSIGKVVGTAHCIFAGRKWKRDAAKEAGFEVDVWIDDMPATIERQLLIGQ